MTTFTERLYMQNKSVFVSAGHSDRDPGAVGNGYSEADVVLKLRDDIVEYLNAKGIVVTRDGSQGENLPLARAIEIAQEHDFSIELHCNSFVDPRATGVETLNDPYFDQEGKVLCEAVASALGIDNRGVKGEGSGQHSRLGFISKGGGIILELFFLSNPDDLRSYKNNYRRLVTTLGDAIIEEVCS